MAELWQRIHKFIHGRDWIRKNDPTVTTSHAEHQSISQQCDYAMWQRRHGSKSSQHAMASNGRKARSDHSSRVVRKRPSRSSLTNSRDSSVLLLSREHQLARERQEYLDAAVPKELQRSKVSCDLHDLTMSDEAGQRPYCEDVAERNMRKNAHALKSVPRRSTSLPRSPQQARNFRHKDRSPPCSYPIQKMAVRTADHGQDKTCSAEMCMQPSLKLGIAKVPERRSKSINEQTTVLGWQPSTREQRSHSLTHKPNIFDLRNTCEVGGFRPEQSHLGSQGSRRNSIKRSHLQKPLPPVPVSGLRNATEHEPDLRQTNLAQRDQSLTTIQQSSISPPSPGRSEATTVYERWAPAITRETITHNWHEVREEYIHKDIHQYHVKHRIQPVIEYEILPPRHFVSEGEGFREIDHEHIPLGRPNTEWYTAEVAANLESIINDQHTLDSDQSMTSYDVVEIPGSETLEFADHRYRESSDFDGKEPNTDFPRRLSMATSAAISRCSSPPIQDPRAVRTACNDSTPTPRMRRA